VQAYHDDDAELYQLHHLASVCTPVVPMAMIRRDTVLAMFKLPMIYTFIAATVWRTFSLPVPKPVWAGSGTLAQGLVPDCTCQLSGAQMATLKSHRFSREMSVTPFLRLYTGTGSRLLHREAA
jgi:hypothetical protein